MKANYEITVKGRVQGVGYRYFVRKTALEHTLTGYVRNLPGPAVHIVAEGETGDLETFVDYLKTGPPMARVTGMEISRAPASGHYTGFIIR